MLSERKEPTPATNWDDLPLLMRAEEVALVVRRSPAAITKAAIAGRFRPEPVSRRPFLWNRDELRKAYESAPVGTEHAPDEAEPSRVTA